MIFSRARFEVFVALMISLVNDFASKLHFLNLSTDVRSPEIELVTPGTAATRSSIVAINFSPTIIMQQFVALI